MPQRLLFIVVCLLAAVSGSGCVVTDIGVSNPVPEIRRIAVAPFINLTTEPDVDLGRNALFAGGYSDRRFARAYFAELQKVPGYEVIPVGVVDQAIASSAREINGPADYLAIAKMIGADAIVVGAVTDFDPYHPRLGLQVQWYAHDHAVLPAPTMPFEREWDEQNYKVPEEPHDGWWSRRRGTPHPRDCERCEVTSVSKDSRTVRGQSPTTPRQLPAVTVAEPLNPPGVVENVPPLPREITDAERHLYGLPPEMPFTLQKPMAVEILPLYSYTRMFDGHDARLTARLRDYVELSGDTRSGGWESYLDRSDDFIRFASHLMISEMLMLHGGESSRRTVFKHRKQLSRKL